jgi:hypothetical protein
VAGCCEYGDEPAGSGATELVSGLFNDAVTTSQCIASNHTIFMNDKSESMSKESLVAYFKILSQHLRGGTEEEQRKSRPLSGPAFGPGTFFT